MKNIAKYLAFALVLSVIVRADGNVQNPTTTAVFLTGMQASTTCVESTVAAGSATSVTVPGLAGQYFYIVTVSSMLNAIAAPVATLYPTTSTNVPGSYSVRQAVQAAVGNFVYNENFGPGGLKTSVAGTNTTFSGTALANVSASFRVCGFYGL